MTSHVAQFFVQVEEWERTLADHKRALVSGGRLVFDTRDPQDRGWEKWNLEDSFRWITMSDGRVVEAWTEVTDIRDGAVSFAIHYEFPYGKALLSTATLRFRPEDHVRAFLKHADLRWLESRKCWGGRRRVARHRPSVSLRRGWIAKHSVGRRVATAWPTIEENRSCLISATLTAFDTICPGRMYLRRPF